MGSMIPVTADKVYQSKLWKLLYKLEIEVKVKP